MLIEVTLTASDIIILCVVGIIQDEVLYCTYILLMMKCYIVLLMLLHRFTCFS